MMMFSLLKQQPKHTHLLSLNNHRCFARYLNKAQQMHHDAKVDLTAYQYKPELIYRIAPDPEYPD